VSRLIITVIASHPAAICKRSAVGLRTFHEGFDFWLPENYCRP